MQFEEFDKKAIEAADHYYPPYDEQAWTKMEKLLDIHLPQKKDKRRRFLFFLLFPGLIVGGLLIAKPWKTKKPMTATEKINRPPQSDKSSESIKPNENEYSEKRVIIPDANELIKEKNKEITSSLLKQEMPTANVNLTENIQTKKSINKIIGRSTPSKRDQQKVETFISANLKERKQVEDIFTEEKAEPKGAGINENTLSPVTTKSKLTNEQISTTTEFASINTKPVKEEIEKLSTEKTQKDSIEPIIPGNKKNASKKKNSFFFTLSAGPDVSFAGNNKLGTSKLFAGLGIGFTFNDRFTIRSGFYSGRKVYSASPDAYHPPAVFYIYYPYLEKVDADCKVYEIPVSVSYNFSTSSKHHFFASAGLSSYLMKTEKYNYFYKYNPTGPTLNKEWTINNKNKHFFSALTLSGGYQLKVNNRIIFIAEPYLKLPLSGIGYGKVKLNSGGVLFSIGIKPFK